MTTLSNAAKNQTKAVQLAFDQYRIDQQAEVQKEQQHLIQQYNQALEQKNEAITKSWQDNWANLSTIFAYPPQNSVIRHVTNKRKIFPSDDSARKIIYLAVMNASKKWTMPIQNWREAMNWFMI